MKFPLILKDKNNNILKQHITITEPTFFIKSYKKFGILFNDVSEEINSKDEFQHINVLELSNGFDMIEYSDIVNEPERLQDIFDTDKPLLYSVYKPIATRDDIEIVKGNSFTGIHSNYSYSLYLGEKEKYVLLICYDFENNTYHNILIHYRPFDKLNSNEEHYQNYIDNYSLPNLEELSTIIFKDENKYVMLRKLLLDFREIKKHRGKLKSIEKFLNYLGFDPDTIKLYPEYITPNKVKTINPNKEVDVKTGYYHLIFDNYDIDPDRRYTPDNLPYIKSQFKNVDDLFEKLIRALAIAHKYFTVDEQEMSFLGINNMFNVRKYLSVAGNMTTTFFIDTLHFRKHIEIDIFNKTSIASNPYYIVKNNRQNNIDVTKTEVKYYVKNLPKNNQLFFIDREIVDERHRTDLSEEEQMKIQYDFGNILNISIHSPNTFVQFKIINTDNRLIQYTSEKIWVTNNLLERKIFVRPNGLYKIYVYVYDNYGAREEFIYQVRLNKVHIDFDIFDSSEIIYDKNRLTSVWDGGILTQDIDSTHKLTDKNDTGNNLHNRIITDEYTTPDNYINQYFEHIANNPDSNTLENLYSWEQYVLPRLNKNIIMSKLTETLTTQFVDNFQHFLVFRYPRGWRVEFDKDLLYGKLIYLNIWNEAVNNYMITNYYIITPKTNSVDINPLLHNIKISGTQLGVAWSMNTEELLNKKFNDSVLKAFRNLTFNMDNLYNQFDLRNFYLPLNFDITFDKTEQTNLESVFPRLNNRTYDTDVDILRQGDIFVCRLNSKYVSGAKDIEWTLLNSFTGKVISKQKSFSLKHRIVNNEVYDIILSLTINGQNHTIRKNNIISSFE